jgi:hypothetical protein
MAIEYDLFLHEEVLLIALHDEKGTTPALTGIALGGAILGELTFRGQVEIESTKKKLVNVANSRLPGDPVLDECLNRMREAKRRASATTWVSRFSGLSRLHHRVARRLVERGILRAEERRVLGIFRRDAYPTVDARPERQIVERLRTAIFRDSQRVDERTRLLLGVAQPASLLPLVFDRKELKARRKHIQSLIEGDALSRAVSTIVDAVHTAVIVAAS